MSREKIMTMINEGKGDALGSFVREHFEGATFYGTKADNRAVNPDQSVLTRSAGRR
jgi:hypothetical protein